MYISSEADQIENLKRELRKTTQLLDAVILAYKERGECIEELKIAAFHFGYSLSQKEFKWYDKKE